MPPDSGASGRWFLSPQPQLRAPPPRLQRLRKESAAVPEAAPTDLSRGTDQKRTLVYSSLASASRLSLWVPGKPRPFPRPTSTP